MHRLNVAILSLWLALAPAFAQVGGLSFPGPGPRVASASYTGPVDVNGTAWAIWSTRCPSNAFSGSMMDIVAGTGPTGTTGTRLQCSAGGVISAVVSASACATTTNGNSFVTGGACSPLATTCATSCSALTMYDMSGGNNCGGGPCDVTNTGAGASNPVITSSCLSSKVCLVGNGTTACLRSPVNNSALAQPMTISAVINRTGGFTTRQFFISNDVGDIEVGWNNAANTTWAIAGNNDITATMSDSATHAQQLIITQTPTSSSSSWYIDGTSIPSNDVIGTNGWTANKLQLFSFGNCALDFFQGNWFETGIWSGDKSANNSTINSNQHTFWSF